MLLTKLEKVTVGSDPEVFLFDPIKNKYVSAIGLIGGTKEKPLPVPLGKGFYVQEDNVLLEYNTPATTTPTAWENSHSKMLDFIVNMLKPKGLEIKVDASAEMPDEELQDPRAHVFGCEPDFNAWTLHVNPRPFSLNLKLRSAGGHVHIGHPLTKEQKINLVRWLDIYLGIPSIIADPDKNRRQLYGKLGAFRWKPYGVEYRVLSNFWLKTPNSVNTVWKGVQYAVTGAVSGKLPPAISQEHLTELNAGNASLAKDYANMYGLSFV